MRLSVINLSYNFYLNLKFVLKVIFTLKKNNEKILTKYFLIIKNIYLFFDEFSKNTVIK